MLTLLWPSLCLLLTSAVDYGSKYKLLTAAGQLSWPWRGTIWTSDLQVGAAGLTDGVNTPLWSTVPVLCVNRTFSWNRVTVQLWKYLCVIYSSEDVTYKDVCTRCCSSHKHLLFCGGENSNTNTVGSHRLNKNSNVIPAWTFNALWSYVWRSKWCQ